MTQRKNIPEWDTFYKENDVEKMPWYEKNLDPDLEYQINSMNITKGKFLDLGTGPGTQAIQLDKLGFEATGSDISKSAIEKAQQLSNNVSFVVDDILNSSFPDNTFDYILDRGCFHVFEPSLRKDYLNQIKKILKNEGILFLKVMSIEEKGLPGDEGPYRFSQQEILDTFEKDFEIVEIKSTVYYGTLDPLPKALFAVIKQKI
jgi:SAM-dependent methyltransferase